MTARSSARATSRRPASARTLARYGDRVRILVTNDDGVDAPGIKPLAVALAADGHDVVVVAPTSDRSGSGAAIGKLFGTEPPEIVRHVWPELPGVAVHALDAPPATAVLGAALGAFGDPPDLVASGINPGANTGHLVIHSGTVGAALTAAGPRHPGARGEPPVEHGDASTTGRPRRGSRPPRSSGWRRPTAACRACSTSTSRTCPCTK